MSSFEVLGSGAFVVRGLLDAAWCEETIRRAEAIGFYEAPVNGRGGEQRIASVRNNDRVMIDDVEEAARLWGLIGEQLTPPWRRAPGLILGEPGAELVVAGLNERLRIYRYHPGQYFKPHKDGRFVRDNGEVSMLTVLCFLNEVEEGGQTRLWLEREPTDVTPHPGDVLIFDHSLLHEGRHVARGSKYVLRTDVMYRLERRP